MNALGWLTPTTVSDASQLMDWIRDYICKPHPDLGRKGPVCPFVPPSLRRDQLFMTFHYEVDGHSPHEIECLIRYYGQLFLETKADSTDSTLLVAFPKIPADRQPVMDRVHAEVKPDLVRQGLMAGQFHVSCPEPAARNPLFPVSISPIPFVALRHMAVHDILFLHGNAEWFEVYRARFGERYEQGQIRDQVFVRLFKEASEQRREAS
jgi:hypothetical protein